MAKQPVTSFGRDIEMTADELNEFLAHSDDSDQEDGKKSDALLADDDWGDMPEIDIDEFMQQTTAAKSVELKTSTSNSNRLKRIWGNTDNQAAGSSKSVVPPTKKLKKQDIGIDMLFAETKEDTPPENDSSLRNNNADSDEEDLCNEIVERAYLNPDGRLVKQKLKEASRAIADERVERDIHRAERLANQERAKQQLAEEDRAKSEANRDMLRKTMEEKRQKIVADLKKSQCPYTKSVAANQGDYFMPSPCRIRVKNPRISSELWLTRTAERIVISLSDLHWQRRQKELGSLEWITVGVLATKAGPMKSKKGSSYSIWRLTDLEQTDRLICLFLFGRVHDDLWKEVEGSVVALLKPKIMDDNRGGDSAGSNKFSGEDPSLTIENSMQVMLLGQSVDFGSCLGVTKAGNKCTKIVNKALTQYCDFHVKSAYTKASLSRPGFANMSCPTFKAKKNQPKPPGVYVSSHSAGTFTLEEEKPTSTAPKPKLTEMTLSKLVKRPELSATAVDWGLIDQESLKQIPVKSPPNTSSSKIKSTNSSNPAKTKPNSEPTLTARPSMSIPAEKKAEIVSKNEEVFASMLVRPSAGSMNFVKHLIQKELPTTTAQQSANKSLNRSISDVGSNADKSNKPSGSLFSKFFTDFRSSGAPQLGRGLSSDGFVDLGGVPKRTSLTHEVDSRAAAIARKDWLIRQKAIELVKSKGGMSRMKSEAKKKRQQDLKHNLENVKPVDSQSEPSSSQAPPKQKKIVVGGKALDADELKRALSRGSAHRDLVQVEEKAEEEAYFNKMGTKEQLEERLTALHEQSVKVVFCKKCRYKAMSAADTCKSEGHPLVRYDGMRRFFKCAECKERTTTLERYPETVCKKCGGSSFEKAGMKAERKGPKLLAETLQLRGEETKFLNSVK